MTVTTVSPLINSWLTWRVSSLGIHGWFILVFPPVSPVPPVSLVLSMFRFTRLRSAWVSTKVFSLVLLSAVLTSKLGSFSSPAFTLWSIDFPCCKDTHKNCQCKCKRQEVNLTLHIRSDLACHRLGLILPGQWLFLSGSFAQGDTWTRKQERDRLIYQGRCMERAVWSLRVFVPLQTSPICHNILTWQLWAFLNLRRPDLLSHNGFLYVSSTSTIA